MSEIVNGLMLSDATRARLVEIAQLYDATKAELVRAYEAGEISPAQLEKRAKVLMQELQALAAPITREVDAAMELARLEHQGVSDEPGNPLH